jgi:hypothetical protein
MGHERHEEEVKEAKHRVFLDARHVHEQQNSVADARGTVNADLQAKL